MLAKIITKILIPLAITTFWGAMTYDLVRDRILPDRVRARTALIDPGVLALTWSDIQEWYWILHNGEKRGATALDISQNKRHPDRYVLRQETRVQIPVLGLPQKIETNVHILLHNDFTIDRFDAEAQVASLSIQAQGFVRDKRLYYRFTRSQGAAPTYGFLELGETPLSLADAVREMKSRHSELAIGNVYYYDALDPLGAFDAGKIKVEVAALEKIEHQGRIIDAYRLDTTFNDITKKAWVDVGGRMIRREISMGYIAEQASLRDVIELYPKRWVQPRLMPEFDEKTFIEDAKKQKGAPPTSPSVGGGGFLGGLLLEAGAKALLPGDQKK